MSHAHWRRIMVVSPAVSWPRLAVSRPKVAPSATIQNVVSRPSASQAACARATARPYARLAVSWHMSRPYRGRSVAVSWPRLAVSWPLQLCPVAPCVNDTIHCIVTQMDSSPSSLCFFFSFFFSHHFFFLICSPIGRPQKFYYCYYYFSFSSITK